MFNIITLFAAACSKPTFFGLIPWYQYLKLDPSNNCEVLNFQIMPTAASGGDIPLVLLAIIDDLLRIAGMAAVAYVIYASFIYLTSQGNPEQTSKALKTLINALIGMAIAIVAIGVVTFLGTTLGA